MGSTWPIGMAVLIGAMIIHSIVSEYRRRSKKK